MIRETFYPGETFNFKKGRVSYVATIHADDSHSAPWKECDGHGPVSDWTTRGKRPGEMVLNQDGRSKRYYDFAGACRIARRDGCGSLPGEMVIERNNHHGPRKFRAYVNGKPEMRAYGKDQNAAIGALYTIYRASMTARQWAAAAAMRDFEYLQSWCQDDWQYIGIEVRRADACQCCGESESLCGIESNSGDYVRDVATDLAEQLSATRRTCRA